PDADTAAATAEGPVEPTPASVSDLDSSTTDDLLHIPVRSLTRIGFEKTLELHRAVSGQPCGARDFTRALTAEMLSGTFLSRDEGDAESAPAVPRDVRRIHMRHTSRRAWEAFASRGARPLDPERIAEVEAWTRGSEGAPARRAIRILERFSQVAREIELLSRKSEAPPTLGDQG